MTEKMLKQDEIDALFEAARTSIPEASRPEVRARVVPYNFSSAGQISTDQLRAISMLNDLFARNLTHNLAAWLRTRFQVNLVSAEQIQFNEFVLRIPEISYVASVRLEPLGALSVLQLDLTDIEESILGSVVEIICRELTVAWQPVGLSFNFERRQMQTQVARIMSVTEKTLCLSFEIRMPHSAGLLNLAFPAVVANTILRRIHFGGSLQLPTFRLAASAIESLEPGTILRFDLPANTSPEWRVGGQALSQAQAIRQGPHRAARIERAFNEVEA